VFGANVMKWKLLGIAILCLGVPGSLGAFDLLESAAVSGNSGQVSYDREAPDRSAISVRIEPGASGFPGIALKPDGEPWNASAHNHIVASIRNSGSERMTFNLRVDNPGDWRTQPWNVEKIVVEPGETRELRTFFGYHHGGKQGFALDPAKISGVQIFTSKVTDKPALFSVLHIRAAGTAGEVPDFLTGVAARVPPDGLMFSAVEGFDDGVRIIRNPDGQGIVITRERGLWDLREFSEVLVAPVAELEGIEMRAADRSGHFTAWHRGKVSFEIDEPWQGDLREGVEDRIHAFDSRRVKAIELRSAGAGTLNSLQIAGVKAITGVFERPLWHGQRPPVEGDWKLTFSEEFDGNSIDDARWNVTGPNYWGARHLTHWSKDNVIVAGGTARIRMEKKHGFHNDDPSGEATDYAGGYLDTYDKWRQRYGYFEARLKLPRADGLWPAFWMMPDTGREAGPMWKRQKTEPLGMEFDILEYLTAWGPNRYHIAMHWDGYGKNHRSIGTSGIYFRPDEEGFVTAGLLWLPGEAVFYTNGKVVGRVRSERISTVPGMFLLTMPIGGWDNRPIDDQQLPADFMIDYVKAWQRSDLASETDGFFE